MVSMWGSCQFKRVLVAIRNKKDRSACVSTQFGQNHRIQLLQNIVPDKILFQPKSTDIFLFLHKRTYVMGTGTH